MKSNEMTPEQIEAKRKYDREAKRKSRAAQRAARYVPTANEAADSFTADHPERAKELDQIVKDFTTKVYVELGRELRNVGEEFVIDRVARCLLGLKRGWVQVVTQPDGDLVSGSYFADVSGDIVESAHRHGLKESPAFVELYTELLKLVDRRYGNQPTEDAAIVKAELAGTYVLPQLPELPKPESQESPEEPLSSMTEILERGRIELLNRLHPEPQPPRSSVHDANMSPAARRYLDGL